MTIPSRKWETYEQVAAYLLGECATHFGLGTFDGKQIVVGQSGTEWEIDAKGLGADAGQFVIVECKRHTKTGISQALAASLAWSIQDTGAAGGILVSPLGFQEGAKKVAATAGIVEVKLNADCSTTEYVLAFLNKVRVGLHDTLTTEESISYVITSNPPRT